MELWIRSQNRNNLIKATNIKVEYNGDVDPTIHTYRIINDDTILGMYKSKERALEVLDEIQELILGKEQYIYNLTNCFEFLKSGHYSNLPINIKISSDNIVYEMPKE